MTREAAGGRVHQVVQVLLAVLVGAGMLALFLLVLAWAPLDRRWGRRGRRPATLRSAAGHPPAGEAAGAYAIGPSAVATQDTASHPPAHGFGGADSRVVSA